MPDEQNECIFDLQIQVLYVVDVRLFQMSEKSLRIIYTSDQPMKLVSIFLKS